MPAGPPDAHPVDPDDTLTTQRDEDIVSVQSIRPTDLPAGYRRTVHVDVTIPIPPDPQLFVDELGKKWRLAGVDPDGGRRFVLDGVNPETTPRLAWAHEDELIPVVGRLVPFGGAA